MWNEIIDEQIAWWQSKRWAPGDALEAMGYGLALTNPNPNDPPTWGQVREAMIVKYTELRERRERNDAE